MTCISQKLEMNNHAKTPHTANNFLKKNSCRDANRSHNSTIDDGKICIYEIVNKFLILGVIMNENPTFFVRFYNRYCSR